MSQILLKAITSESPIYLTTDNGECRMRPNYAPHKDVTLHLVDNNVLLLHAERGDLIQLNQTAAYLWCCLEDGLELDGMISEYATAYSKSEDQAKKEIHETLVEFSGHGLLEGGTTSPEACHPRPPADPPTCRTKNLALEGPHQSFQLLNTNFDVYYPNAEIRDAVGQILVQFAKSIISADVVVSVVLRDNGYAIFVDYQEMEASLSASELIPQVKSTLLVAAINRFEFGAYFHSAVLSTGSGLLLLPGAAGSGKTCLTLALSLRGFGYVSDETALLDMETMLVHAIPLSPCVKADAWDVMSALYPGLTALPSYQRVDGKEVKYLPLPDWQEKGLRGVARPVRWIVFPKYRPGQSTELRRVNRIDALQRLIQDCNAWRVHLTPEVVDRIIEWICDVLCYELDYASLDEAVIEIADVCWREGVPNNSG